MNDISRRLAPIVALAAGLLVFSHAAHAFQAAEGQNKPVAEAETEAEAEAEAEKTPAKVTKRVKFIAADKPVSFKQRLEVYNRAKQDKDRLYCREDRITGSHRKQMRCITQEMRQMEEDAARAFFRQVGR